MNEFENQNLVLKGGAQASYYNDGPKMAHAPTIKQRLDFAVQKAEANLAAVKEARDIFDRNPDMEKLLDLMQRGSF